MGVWLTGCVCRSLLAPTAARDKGERKAGRRGRPAKEARAAVTTGPVSKPPTREVPASSPTWEQAYGKK
jgi:hypothetical protein